MAASHISKQRIHPFRTAYFQVWRQVLRRMYIKNLVLWFNSKQVKETIGR
jgi:hypothetical protein